MNAASGDIEYALFHGVDDSCGVESTNNRENCYRICRNNTDFRYVTILHLPRVGISLGSRQLANIVEINQRMDTFTISPIWYGFSSSLFFFCS